MAAASVLSAAYLITSARSAWKVMPQTISSIVSEHVKGRFRVGKVDVSLKGMVFHDVSLSSDERGLDRFLDAESVRVGVRLLDIIRGGDDPLRSIETVEVIRANAFLERGTDGRWNVSGLLKPSKDRSLDRFRAMVVVEEGTVTLLDRKVEGAPRTNRLVGINALADLTKAPVAAVRLAAEGDPKRLGKLSVVGRYDLAAHSFEGQFNGLDADAAYWAKYPHDLRFMQVEAGRADVRMTFSQAGEDDPFRYDAAVLVSDASVRLNWMREPATGVAGTVRLKDEKVSISLKARLGSAPVLVAGNVVGFDDIRLALDLQSERANFREISRVLGVALPKGTVLPTAGRALVSVTGPSKSPAAAFRLEAPGVAYGEYAADVIRLEGRYGADSVSFRGSVGRFAGGSARFAGEVGWGARPQVNVQGAAAGVNLSRLPIFSGHPVEALTSGGFTVAWKPAGLLASYSGTIAEGSLQGHEFGSGEVAVSYDGSVARVEDFSARTLGGRVAFSGSVSSEGDLDLKASGSGIDVAEIQKVYWERPSSGTLQFAGRLGGRAESPTFDGRIEGYDIKYGEVGAERITADVNASRDRIVLREMEVNRSEATLMAAGEISHPLSIIHRADLSLHLQDFDVARWAESAGLPAELDGRLWADLTVSGMLASPEIAGSVRVEDGRVAGAALDSAEGRVSYRNSVIALEDLEVRIGAGVLDASGTFGLKDDRISAAFDARAIPLGRLTGGVRKYASLSGDLDLRGQIFGTSELPEVRATLSSGNPAFNGESFGRLAADLTWIGDSVHVGRASIADGEAEYSVSDLWWSSSLKTVEFAGEVRDAPIEKLKAVAEKSPRNESTVILHRRLASIPKPLKGVLNARVSGRFEVTENGLNPRVGIEAKVSEAAVGPSSMQTIDLEADWNGDVFSVRKIEALNGDTDLIAEAVFGPEERIGLRLDAHGLDVGQAGEWLKLKQNISGVGDVTMIAEGTAEAPSVDASFDIQHPVIEGMAFDALRARFSSSSGDDGESPQDRINIDDLTVVLGESQLSASGFIPIDWANRKVPRDGDLFMEMLVDEKSLELLSAFAGDAIEGETGGTLAGKLNLTGTIDSPALQGGLAWREGRVKVARLNETFEQIEADIILDRHMLSVDRLAGLSSGGGGFSVSGQVDLTGMKPRLDLAAETSAMRLSGHNISGQYGEEVSLVLDSSLAAVGDWRKPLLSGNVSIPSGTVRLTEADDNPKQNEPLAFDPEFDLRILSGRDLIMKSSRLETGLPGYLSVGGRLSAPAVDGTISLADGTIMLPLRSFKMMPGSEMQIRLTPGQPVMVLLDIQARGTLVDISPLGKRTRYTVTMEATGPLDHLRPTFTSSPVGLSEQRIIALATGQYHFEQILRGNSGQDIGRELSGLFSSAMLPTVFEPIEQALEEAFGVDEFSLEMGYREAVQVSISDQLGGDFFISYSAALGSRPDYADSQYELKLSYRLRNYLELSGWTGDNKVFGVSAEGRIRF